MKIGTRITLSTVALVMVALAAYGAISIRGRRAELEADLERETQSLGSALQVVLESAATSRQRVRLVAELERQAEARCTRACTPPEFAVGPAMEGALRESLDELDIAKLVSRVRARERSLGMAFVELSGVAAPSSPLDGGLRLDAGDDDEPAVAPPPPGPSQEARVRWVQITGTPYGEHLEQGGRSVYAYTVPIRGQRQEVVAAVDLTRDASEIDAVLLASIRDAAIAVVLASVVLALLVFVTVRGGVTQPLARLVEGIDEVSRGDLTRALLREREDEIGDLAERFNQMTKSLREARAETERGVEARMGLEARLRHSEKLATIGQLAAGIAHEVGTPLGVIGGRARTLEKRAGAALAAGGDGSPVDAAEVARNAGIIAAQAARITRIIQQLLDYSRKKVAERGAVDIAGEAKATVDFLDHQIAGRHIELRVVPHAFEAGGPAAPIALGDADQLQQVCLNLCLNAIQAMPEGGRLEISTRGVSRRKPGLDTAPPGGYVVFAVADTGAGIPPGDRERIFEPFYSTKQDDGGTGLGLSVSQGIVKDHDGWIEIDDRADGRGGHGTIFRVFLPGFDEAAGASRRGDVTAPPVVSPIDEGG